MTKQPAEVKTDAPLKSSNKDLLSQFYGLASLDESTRVQAIANIIKIIKISDNEADLDYTVERLVKGLGSSRKAARQGYATALTHLMQEKREITKDQILNLVSKNLAVTGAVKGQDEKDHYFGQVFAFLVIFKSQLKENLTDSEQVVTVIENLMTLSKKKSYLLEICGKGICDIIQMIDFDTYENHVSKVLEPILTCGWAKCTPEQLLIVLTIRNAFKTNLESDYFEKNWEHNDIIHHDNIPHMTRVLMETTNTSHPRVHILWELILEDVLADSFKEHFQTFWETVVEGGLLQSTHERKFLAISILIKICKRMSVDQVPVVFSKTLLRCIINSCQSKENYLYNAVKEMLKKLSSAVVLNTDENIIPLVIQALVGSYGNVSFDAMTHSKSIEELTSKISNNCMKSYISWLYEVFAIGTTGMQQQDKAIPVKDVTACRNWVMNQLVILVRCCKHDEEMMMEMVNFLFLHSYFTILKKTKKHSLVNTVPTPPLTESEQLLCQKRFISVLTDITHFQRPVQTDQKSQQAISGVALDGDFFAYKALQFSQKLLGLPKFVQLTHVWTPEIYDSFNNALEQIDTMKDDDSGSIARNKGTQLLFVHTTLQLFSNGEEAVDILQELQTCYNKAEENKKRKKTEPHWTEVLTEVLLGFLAQPSHLLRQVVDAVFPSITPHLTEEAFQLLINAIRPKSEDEGFNVEENDSEVEMEVDNTKDKTKSKDEEENESEIVENNADDSSSSDDSDDDSDIEIDEKFKAELKVALGNSAVNSDDEEDDDDDEEVIDMDTCDPRLLDEMDQALASVFKARQQKDTDKTNKKNMKQTVLHFKLRVLDLIEIFIRKQPKDKKILLLIDVLLDVIKLSHGNADELALFERTLGIYKNRLCHLHEYPSGIDLNTDYVHSKIEELVEMAKSASSALFVNYVTLGVIYLIRVLRGTPELKEPSPLKTRAQRKRRETMTPQVMTNDLHIGCLDERRLVTCCSDALSDFMTKRSSHLQPSLFIEIIQRFPEIGWMFSKNLPSYLNTGCNNFRKVKACEMLKLLVNKMPHETHSHLISMSPSIVENLSKFFESAKEEGFSLKARQFHDVIHLADVFVKEASKFPELKNSLDRDELQTSLKGSLESPVVQRSTSLHSYCEKFINTLNNVGSIENEKKKKKKKNKKQTS